MKLKQGICYQSFLLTVRKCKGDVLYKTPDGDCLNLKSLLSEYVFIAASSSREIPLDGYVECNQESDYRRLRKYFEAG